MTWDEYYANLKLLPIANPTMEDFASVTPHLNQSQLTNTIVDGNDIAIPPLRVRHSYQVLGYRQGILGLSNPIRTLYSYADGMSHGDIFHSKLYEKAAMQYAVANWDDKLTLQTWESHGTMELMDPRQFDNWGNPKGVMMVYYTLTKTLQETRDMELSEDILRSIIWNEDIGELTTDYILGREFKDGRAGSQSDNCSICGYGLGLDRCENCGVRFKLSSFRASSVTPLPEKIVKLLQENGHVFELDISRAWEKEEILQKTYRAERNRRRYSLL